MFKPPPRAFDVFLKKFLIAVSVPYLGYTFYKLHQVIEVRKERRRLKEITENGESQLKGIHTRLPDSEKIPMV